MAEVKLTEHTLHPRLFYSPLQAERRRFAPPVPTVLDNHAASIAVVEKEALGAAGDKEEIQKQFPHTYGKPRVEFAAGKGVEARPLRMGVVLSGGQAPGGHNVIAGLYDGVKTFHADSVLIGFLHGPKGIFTGNYCVIDEHLMSGFRNTGGFDMICSGRDKIETPEHFNGCLSVCTQLNLDGLVVIGGDDSNTNAAVLAEFFVAQKCKTVVIGAPKTIDGDLKNEYIPISFGFDTACRVFSEQIANVALDTLATQKYWHFIRLMGRSASSIALECALQTRPNVCLIGEEVKAKNQGLKDISQQIANLVVERSKRGQTYGVVLLPEGLIEFMPEFMSLIGEINDVLASGVPASPKEVQAALKGDNADKFAYLPLAIQEQLVLDRDPHGNVQVSLIETEKLLGSTVAAELKALGYDGHFDPQYLFCGYEGRSALPSPFDTTYTYVLGRTAAVLAANQLTGLMASVRDLNKDVSEWSCGGVPITMMCCMEKRKGKFKPVIQKALVELDGPRSQPFQVLAARRDQWALVDAYRCVGPLQLDAKLELCRTLHYELCGVDDEEREGKAVLEHIGAARHERSGFAFRIHPRECLSDVCVERLSTPITLPAALSSLRVAKGDAVQPTQPGDAALLASLFPKSGNGPIVMFGGEGEEPSSAKARVGIVFCGRQAAGAHNVVWGVFDAVTKLNKDSEVLGFVHGTKGMFAQKHVVITREMVDAYRNQGGMHMLGRSSDRIRMTDEKEKAAKACKDLSLTSLILVGSARTHTDAAYLAEYFAANNVGTAVVACPVGIGGDMMQGKFVQATVGFDTACRVSAHVVGNTATDGASNLKYYYFIRLNSGGHVTSHVALEIALQTHPNVVLLSEEVAANHKSLRDIAGDVADVVCKRAEHGKNFGTVVMPEGLLAAVPEMGALIKELDNLSAQLHQGEESLTVERVVPHITPWAASLLTSLPEFASAQLLRQKQSDGKTDLSKIDTERLIAHYVTLELSKRKEAGQYKGKFAVITSIRSYQARSALPTQFDCELGYSVGCTAAALAAHGLNGYFAAITNLHNNVSEWRVAGAPLTALLIADNSDFLDEDHSVRPVVTPAGVPFDCPAYRQLGQARHSWANEECNINPGPVQFHGDTLHDRPRTLALAKDNYLGDLDELWHAIAGVKEMCRPGCNRSVLLLARKMLGALDDVVAANAQSALPLPN